MLEKSESILKQNKEKIEKVESPAKSQKEEKKDFEIKNWVDSNTKWFDNLLLIGSTITAK